MMDLSKYIVKITCKNEIGSGFIYLPLGDPQRAYIFTARHCIYGKDVDNNADKTDVSITFYSGAKHIEKSYTVSNEDVLVAGANNATEDIAIIIISKESIPDGCISEESPKLILLSGSEKECFISGVPKVTGNLYPRTLQNCFIDPDKDYPYQIQVSVKDAIVDNFNADELVEGYSGSGCFIDNQKGIYAFGIVLSYEEASKRLLGINFSIVNSLLQKNSLPVIRFLTIETDQNILKDTDKLSENTKKVLGRVRTNIGEIHLERKEIEDLLRSMISKSPLTLVSGKAGMGKSAIAKKVLESLKDKFSIIALRGEELDRGSIPLILRDLQINSDLNCLLDSPALSRNKIVVIESIEKLLETNNSETILDFFNLIKSRNDIKLVLTGRSYSIEQLKIRFLKDLPIPSILEVPLLKDELLIVEEKYPHIKSLLAKPGLKKILQIPFNLDKAISIQKEVFDESVTTEKDFKRIMWEYVIENKEKETDAEVRKKRSVTFSDIAYNRAIQMISYVKADSAEAKILESLEKDNIIEVDQKLKNRYSPSHDIFEDWALTRIIEDKFLDWAATSSEIKNYFTAIGDHPAIRRAFRIWLSEKIQEPDYTIEKFLESVLTDITLDRFWKDETLIAIMQSSYSNQLLTKHKELLFNDNFSIFKRCLLLLKVACQTPDFDLIQLVAKKDDIVYQSHYLVPFGDGWPNMINFIHANISELRSVYHSIILILVDWRKGLEESDVLPEEAEKVALIIFDYIGQLKLKYNSVEFGEGDNDKTEECIKLLLRICGAAKEKTKNLIEEALDNKKTTGNYKIRNFYKKVLEYTLSYQESRWLSLHLPATVIKAAEKEWFYYPPTKEELEERNKHSLFKSLPRSPEKEAEFGVIDEGKHNYMPPGGLQTPIRHLLYSIPAETLGFITKLFNHSVDLFIKSDFLLSGIVFKADERKEVSFILNGKEIKQTGTSALWCMYRGGHVATPYVLQSVLMALENWLLGLADISKGKKEPYHAAYKHLLESSFDLLLENNRSVTITSVLVSVATAYPGLLADKILPLLKVREFYKWDLERMTYEREPTFFFNDPQYLIRERQESFSRPHRKRHLEDLLRELVTLGHSEKIYEILDAFYAENPEEVAWKIALNRMDLRKLEFVERTETGFIVQTKIDDDLKEIAIENQKKQDAIYPVTVAANWLRNKYDGKKVEDDSYSEWQKHYKANTSYDKSVKGIGMWVHNGLLAAVGIRDYYDQLSDSERSWCIQCMFSIVIKEANRDPFDTDFDGDAPISVFDAEPVLETLPSLILLTEGKDKVKTKECLFAALAFITNENHKKKLIAAIRNTLWQKVPQFVLACIKGLLAYSDVVTMRDRLKHFNPSNKKEEKQREKEVKKYREKLEKTFNGVLNDDDNIDLNSIGIDTHSMWIITDILTLIPFDTKNKVLLDYIGIVLNIVLKAKETEGGYDREDSVPYQLAQVVEKYYAHFLLSQDKDNVVSKTQLLVDWIFSPDYVQGRYKDKKFEFIESCLTSVMFKIDTEHSLIENFWLVWEYILKKSLESGNTLLVEPMLLSSPDWNPESQEWKPINGKKDFFNRAITHFASIPQTVLLLSGIGFSELMPEGITWYANILRKANLTNTKGDIYFTEKLIQRAFYNKRIRDLVKENPVLRNDFIFILDELIQKNSAVAFLIKEDFISLKKAD
ncbi:MAG: hypothetical protein AB7O73_08165 [Bacteroidia bacterium]